MLSISRVAVGWTKDGKDKPIVVVAGCSTSGEIITNKSNKCE